MVSMTAPPCHTSCATPPAGAYLARCGKVEHKIGESRKRFEDKVMQDVITPLKAFLEIDIKSIIVSFHYVAPVTTSSPNNHLFSPPQRERKALNVKRLDLDARKASTRKAQGDKVATVRTSCDIT